MKLYPYQLAILSGLSAGMFTLSATCTAAEPSMVALAMIESGGNRYAIGKHGERSMYQVSRSVWRTWTTYPFTPGNTANTELASRVVKHHIVWLTETYHKFSGGKYPTDVEIYIMYNMGLEAYRLRQFDTSRVPKQVLDRAMRYANLVHLYSSKN